MQRKKANRGAENTAQFRLVSLFSGGGGLDVGFVKTGRFSMCFANDILSPAAASCLENFGIEVSSSTAAPKESDLPLYLQKDVSEISFEQLEGLEPELLTGGPPCQDFSIVQGGTREGIKVKRGKLYTHFARAMARLCPKVFVFENVPGLVSANNHQALKTITEDFTDLRAISQVAGGWRISEKPLGYEILFSGIVDASKLGVPQGRRRLIILGLRKDLADKLNLSRVRNQAEHTLRGFGTVTAKFPLTPLEVFEGKSLNELGAKYKRLMRQYRLVWEDVGTDRAREWKKVVWGQMTFDVIRDYLRANEVENWNKAELRRAFAEHEQILEGLGYLGRPIYEIEPRDGSNELPREADHVLERMRRIPPGENHEFVRETEWEVEGRGISLIYKRMEPLKPAPTVMAHGGGGTWGYHYDRSRSKLTNRERARLQTFSDDFLFSGTISEVRAQIGEAVPPLLSSRIAEAVLAILQQ